MAVYKDIRSGDIPDAFYSPSRFVFVWHFLCKL